MMTAQFAPVACTLSADDMKSRVADIAELNAKHLRATRRDDLELELIYALEGREGVLEMMERERECCAFLVFHLDEDAQGVRLVIRAPEAARAGAEAVFEPFQSKSVIHRVSGCRCGQIA